MLASDRQLEVLAQNLANASTVGYKRDGVSFNDALERQMFADGGRGRYIGTLGNGPSEQAHFTNFEPGTVDPTGNPLDVAIVDEKGSFAFQSPSGLQFSRDGSFNLNQNKFLVNSRGLQVLDTQGNPIQVRVPGEVEIDEHGNVMAGNQKVGQIGVFDGTYSRVTGTVFTCNNPRLIQNPILRTKAVEGSNVNPIQAMTGMIEIHRNFEFAQKSVQSQDEMTSRLIQALEGL